MKDKFQSLKIKVLTIFDLPSRLLIVGKSELSGKSNLIANLIEREKFYRKYSIQIISLLFVNLVI